VFQKQESMDNEFISLKSDFIESVYHSLKNSEKPMDIITDFEESTKEMKEFDMDASEYGSFTGSVLTNLPIE
jgi:hypothetical protein